jgi:hypothetical protein
LEFVEGGASSERVEEELELRLEQQLEVLGLEELELGEREEGESWLAVAPELAL